MKKLTHAMILLSLGFVLHCVTTVAYTAKSTKKKDAIYAEVLSQVSLKNYQVQNANKDSGFLIAEKAPTGNSFAKTMTGIDSVQQLHINVLDNRPDKKIHIQVIPRAMQIDKNGRKSETNPTSTTIEDAKTLLSTFGEIEEKELE